MQKKKGGGEITLKTFCQACFWRVTVSEMRHAQTMLAIKPEGKNQFATSNRGWEYNIKIYILKRTRRCGLD
jgi:hypothetical protein